MKIIHFEWPWRSVLQQEQAVACLPKQGVFIVRIFAKPVSDIFLVHLLCSCLYHLARWPHAWNSSYLYRLAKWPCAMFIILAFIVRFETVFQYHNVHGAVSTLTNRFFSVTGNRRLGCDRRQYGRLFLVIAGLFFKKCKSPFWNSSAHCDFSTTF